MSQNDSANVWRGDTTRKHDVIPPYSRYTSRFITTSRNVALYWIVNLIVLPTYTALLYLIVQDIVTPQGTEPLISEWLRLPLALLVAFYAAIPIFMNLRAPAHWQTGFKYLEVTVIVSLFVTSSLFFEISTIAAPIVIPTLVWLAIGILRMIFVQPLKIALLIIAAITTIAALLNTLLYHWLVNLDHALFFRCWQILGLGIGAYSLYRIVMWFFINKPPARKSVLLTALIHFFVLVTLFLLYRTGRAQYPQSFGFPAVIAICMILFSSDPMRLVSNQVAYLRSLVRRVRYDHIYSQFSPFVATKNPFNLFLRYRLPKWVSINNYGLFIFICLVGGGIMVPGSVYWMSYQPDAEGWPSTFTPFELIFLGVLSTAVLGLTYMALWLFINRSRYIVTEFQANDEDPIYRARLQSIAKLTTHVLVDELQGITTLLKLRQVENLHFGRDDNNAFFVTSGLNQEFFDQMQQVVTIGLPNEGKLNPVNLMSTMSRFLARIQVRGEIQRGKDRGVEVWVELKYRNQQSATVDLVILPKNSLEEVDEVQIRPVARQLAIQLLIKLGQVPHLGSSWETLDFFLRGLDASTKQNWWQAISFYRQALQAEETARGSFGIGHYHLGAALVFQGSWREGYDHLLTAEADGPPMAEIQYMIALVLLYAYWGELHKRPSVFKEIQYRCERAIQLRKNFAEAYQLLGSTYYRAARNVDRESSKQNPISLKEPKADQDPRQSQRKSGSLVGNLDAMASVFDPQSYYRRALRAYTTALRYYDIRCRAIHFSQEELNKSENHGDDLIQQRMLAAHQIGDALRSLGRYAEAETYYRDVSQILPRNIRNLADLAKVYCLGENWQRAEEYLWREVFKHDVASWDADVTIHMAWALLGGLFDHRTTPAKRFVDRLIQIGRSKNIPSANLWSGKDEDIQTKQWLGEAIEFLDFALYQRPRYLEAWRQSNWVEAIDNAFRILSPRISRFGLLIAHITQRTRSDAEPDGKDKETQDRTAITESNSTNHANNILLPTTAFNFDNPDLRMYLTWLGLRMRSYSRKDYWAENTSNFLKEVRKDPKLRKLHRIQCALILLRTKAAELVQSPRLGEQDYLFRKYNHLHLAQRSYRWWDHAHRFFNGLEKETQMTFVGRWAIDLYNEVTLLTCRLLAEASAFELLYHVSNEASKVSDQWIEVWGDSYKDTESSLKKYHTFSPYVSRYQRATIKAWRAFALLRCYDDNATRVRLECSKNSLIEKVSREQLLEKVQQDIDFARRLVSPHPLALFVQSQVFRLLNLHDQAIEVLEYLLDVIAPFDPKQDVGKVIPSNPRPEPTTNQGRKDLYFIEKVCGRQQFNTIINSSSVHSTLAALYTELGKPELSVRHLMEAIRSSNSEGSVDNIYLQLASELNSMERYAEAHAIVESIRMVNHGRPATDRSHLQSAAPNILECIIHTRSMQYAKSLQKCKEIAHNVQLFSPQNYLHEFVTPHPNDPHWCSFRGAFRELLSTLDAKLSFDGEHAKTDDVIQPEMEEALHRCSKLIASTEQDMKWHSLRDIVNFVVESVDAQSLHTATVDEKFHFPRVFLKLQDDKETPALIAYLGKLAFCVLKESAFRLLFKPNYILQDNARFGKLAGTFQTVMAGEVFMFVGKRAWEDLTQFAELCNSLAYNRAETGLHIHPYAFVDAVSAHVVMAYLVQVSERDTEQHQDFAEKLAQYCDTLGWLYYRKAFHPNLDRQLRNKNEIVGESDPKEILPLLADAEKYLKQGIRYNPTRSIIHYHLARVYVSYVELIWQLNPNALHEEKIGNQAHTIDNYLTQAFRAWRSAQQYDQFGRLHAQLAWINNRINTYKTQWEKRQMSGLTGL